MQISDIDEGVKVLWRRGKIVEYHRDVARYGPIAQHYEGGACWDTAWTPGVLKVIRRQKDSPRSHRHGNFWHKGDICVVWIDGQSEFRMEDVSIDTDSSNQPTGALLMMIENYITQIKLPTDNVEPQESDCTFKG